MSQQDRLARSYLTNALGDVYARIVDGREEPIDPDSWGWSGTRGPTDLRKSLDELRAVPGFTVEERPWPAIAPGPRPKRSVPLFTWTDGSAPAATAVSKASAPDGALGHYGRLSVAVAYVATTLPRNPQSNPFHVYDFVAGRLYEISYEPPPVHPRGKGSVYVVEDGISIKIGYTAGPVALRIAQLQTGNPRLITAILTISPADESAEVHLHNQFGEWNTRGEWYDRNQLLTQARETNGWGNLIRSRLPTGDWEITLYPPYS